MIATSPATALSDAQILERAEALVPSLRERAARIAATRRQPDDVVRDLYDAGLMELLRPSKFGGPGRGVDLVTRVGRALGRGDGSTCWVYLVTAAHDCFVPIYPEAVQEEYWASERPVGASSYIPTGKITPRNGGFVLSGKWSFCSGIDLAGWVLLGGIVGMLENPTRPDFRYFLVSSAQYEILDDWHVMGLRGTGSKSVVLDEVFVPDERVLMAAQVTEGSHLGPPTPNPDYRESVWSAFSFSLSAGATGIAQAAFDATIDALRNRIARKDPAFEAKRAAVQMHLAEASALIDTSDLIFMRSLDATAVRIASGTRLSVHERVRNRRDSCYSIRTALQAAQLLMKLNGGSGIVESNPIQRALRDLYAVAAHPATNWDSPALSYGSVALGGHATEPWA